MVPLLLMWDFPASNLYLDTVCTCFAPLSLSFFICSVCVQSVLHLSVFHGIFTDIIIIIIIYIFKLVNVLLSI